MKFSFASLALSAFALSLGCSAKANPATVQVAQQRPVQPAAKPPVAKPTPPAAGSNAPALTLPPTTLTKIFPVMLGIDVLEADGFKAIAGKKIGLLTHPAGVNRRGEPTWSVLRRASQSKLVALFAPEHGFEGQIKAGSNFGDTRHTATGLPVYSLHGVNRKPTKAQLKGIDALVVDLQDIGVRSYTFSVVMRYAMDACFENGVEVIVLDRPNPLGGEKVDGAPLDPENMSGVGAYPRMPYVHGLTIGEIARMAKFSSAATSGMEITDKVRAAGKLTVLPMRGWTRGMQWPETGLRWVATSPFIQTYESVVGYAMIGLGTQGSGWTWGIGKDFPFRGIAYTKKSPDEIIKTMEAYNIPGVDFVKRQGRDSEGKLIWGVYVEVADWKKWNPTEVSFYMHKQAARWAANPFVKLNTADARSFKIHVGSTAWYAALRRDGGLVNVPLFFNNWVTRAQAYRAQTRKYWLYQ